MLLVLWPLRRFQRSQVPLPGIGGRDQYTCFYCLTLTLAAGKSDWLLAGGLAMLASPQHYSGVLTHGGCFPPGTRSERSRWGSAFCVVYFPKAHASPAALCGSHRPSSIPHERSLSWAWIPEDRATRDHPGRCLPQGFRDVVRG